MVASHFTTESIDYLQRCDIPNGPFAGSYTAGQPATRRLLRVRGVGRPDKDLGRQRDTADRAWRPATTGLLTGLYGYRIPVAFALLGTGEGLQVQIGTWAARTTASPESQNRRRDVLAAVLTGMYPTVALEEVPSEQYRWPLGGLALGIPASSGTDEADGSAPVDRVIRAMAGSVWSALVLAYPVAETTVATVRAQIINEMRLVEAAARTEGAPSPLAKEYVDLLTAGLGALGESMATGAWRTAVYLLGDGDSYPRLAAAWRSFYSGRQSRPEPVRVFDRHEVDGLAGGWAMPDDEGRPGPGQYRRPFEFQTMLTTAQLATYVHLPELEAPGFAVDAAPRFDTVVPAPPRDGGIAVGRVVHNKRETGAEYRIPLASLTRHVFVAGTTGAGKTNTVFSLLAEADAAGVPFLVIEPAKTEYRALLEHSTIGARLRVFTPGKPGVGPVLLNPLEVPPGTAVGEHLDLVRAAFAASFGMWTPLPQILERCLHAVYLDRGWDLRTNANIRLGEGDDPVVAYPTLSDLVAKVAEVVPTLGYDGRVAADMRAALTTRIQSLRIGGKGAALDVARSLPIDDLLGGPTVVELEALGDEGDKAFITALLLIRLAEHRRVAGQTDRLVHLLVVEEAHRLLSNIPTVAAEETANPRGQAVETFANLLSEVRAYGQGIVIADQIPARLAPDVIKNTTLKVAHRMVSADDRTVMAGAMAMEGPQSRAMTTLGVGEAIVYGAADDSPLLVRVPLAKNPMKPEPPADAVVAGRMAAWRATSQLAHLYLPRPFCARTCDRAPAACEAARHLATDEYVQRTLSRTVLSAVHESGALDRLWDDLTAVLRARRPVTVGEPELLRSFAGHGADWLAARRGAQGVWSYRDTAEFRDRVEAVLLAKAGADPNLPRLLALLRDTAHRLHRRAFEPYPACGLICDTEPGLCLYRAAVADQVASARHGTSWREADAADGRSEDGRRQQTWEVCQDAGYELVEFPDADTPADVAPAVEVGGRRACLCFAQQMLAADTDKVPRTSRRILARILTEAGL